MKTCDKGGFWSLTLAQMLAALTTGNNESAFGLTVTSIPGKIFESLSSYLSAGPTVSTNTYKSARQESIEIRFKMIFLVLTGYDPLNSWLCYYQSTRLKFNKLGI